MLSDLAAIPVTKSAADPVGYYSRPDVTRLLLNRAPQNPVDYVPATPDYGTGPRGRLPRKRVAIQNELGDPSLAERNCQATRSGDTTNQHEFSMLLTKDSSVWLAGIRISRKGFRCLSSRRSVPHR